MKKLTRFNAFQLAHMADCSRPDSVESEGASFLLSVQEALASRIPEDFETEEAFREAIESGDLSDLVHEVADGEVPIYTNQLWRTFVDLAAYTEDTSELGEDSSNPDSRAMTALYMVAERLCHALVEEWSSSGEDEGDEEA
jgi:hypothetical protein